MNQREIEKKRKLNIKSLPLIEGYNLKNSLLDIYALILRGRDDGHCHTRFAINDIYETVTIFELVDHLLNLTGVSLDERDERFDYIEELGEHIKNTKPLEDENAIEFLNYYESKNIGPQ